MREGADRLLRRQRRSGALTNVGVASWLYAYQPMWWLAGRAGALMGVVWNYSMSTLLVWRRSEVSLGSGRRTQTQLVLGIVAESLVARARSLRSTPLSFDEAYYWLWSKHLACGYYDHPPMIAFVIRAGTSALRRYQLRRAHRDAPAVDRGWAVWRAGAILLKTSMGARLAPRCCSTRCR